MSGSKLNVYAVGNENITNLMATENALTTGFHAVSLTEWATTTVPQIAAGARVECAGALFYFASNESIGGTAVDGTNYIKLIPAGTSITAEWTQTAPVWNTAYNGWYSPTGGEETYRYLEFIVNKGGTSYYKDYYFPQQQGVTKRLYTCVLPSNQTGMTIGTKINFTTIIDDLLSEYDSDNTRFKAKKTGYVNINIKAVGSATTGSGDFINVKVNGTSVFTTSYGGSAVDQIGINSTSRIIHLNMNDYVEFFANFTYVSLTASGTYLQITDY